MSSDPTLDPLDSMSTYNDHLEYETALLFGAIDTVQQAQTFDELKSAVIDSFAPIHNMFESQYWINDSAIRVLRKLSGSGHGHGHCVGRLPWLR